jgi:hypothetical protein
LWDFDQRPGARVGDYLLTPDGTVTRFTHAWKDSIQTGGSEGGSYYIGQGGYLSYSGGLDPGVPTKFLRETPAFKDGWTWMFSGNHSGAHRGVYYRAPMRVFDLTPIERLADMELFNSTIPVVEVTEEVYDDALDCLPPVHFSGSFFGMGEPIRQNFEGKCFYYFFVKIYGKHYCTIALYEKARERFQKLSQYRREFLGLEG